MSINIEKRSTVLLYTLVVAAIFGTFSGSDEPPIKILEGTWIADVLYKFHSGNTILFNISIGILVSLFFWYLLVKIPESKRRVILQRNLDISYHQFKIDVMRLLLSASIGSYSDDLARELIFYQSFKEYFTENNTNYQRWYDVLNGLEGNPHYLNDILVEMELLARELSYVLDNVHIEDERIHSFFKQMSSHIYRLKNSSIFTNEQVKHIGQFLFGLLARWSAVDGFKDEDVIQDMINAL